MEGYLGIPVFYSPHIRKKLPIVKRILSGNTFETPLFFNYEDLDRTWKNMRKKDPDSQLDPEVFNLWDLLTTMDKRGIGKPTKMRDMNPLQSIKSRFQSKEPGLEHITFVPSSRSVDYKDSISVKGNSKARLPRQRQWMNHSPS